MAEDRIPPGIQERDRGLVREIVFGVVRWLPLLDWHVDRYLKKGPDIPLEVRTALRIAAYQILFLDRVPPYAAVNECVAGLGRMGLAWAKGLSNAVLRRLADRRLTQGMEAARIPEGLDALCPVERLAVLTAHPAWMVKRWVARWGMESALAILHANNSRAPLVLRVNTLRISRARFLERLASHGLHPVPGMYSRDAVILEGFTGNPSHLPGFRDGLFVVQDEGAQLVTFLLDPRPGERILDACAGLGGKTTHIAALMGDEGEVDALDPKASRLGLLRKNVARLGIRSIRILPPAEVEAFVASQTVPAYDRILVDAPCSGLGVIRRHPDIKWNRDEASLGRMAERQRAILEAAATLIPPGGRIVYATCTIEPEETSEVIRAFLARYPGWTVVPADEILDSPARRYATSSGELQILPAPAGPDGFFAIHLRRGKRRRIDQPGRL